VRLVASLALSFCFSGSIFVAGLEVLSPGAFSSKLKAGLSF